MSRVEDEKTFLIELAVTQFNNQYQRAIRQEVCGIRSLPPTYGTTHGYEVETVRSDDHVRIRMYFNLAKATRFDSIRLEVDTTQAVDSLGDEIYVMMGEVSLNYVESDIYRFRWLGEDTTRFRYLNLMTGELVHDMGGNYIRLEEQAV